jgi:hypothetical protein
MSAQLSVASELTFLQEVVHLIGLGLGQEATLHLEGRATLEAVVALGGEEALGGKLVLFVDFSRHLNAIYYILF